jgi:hypothetical protein
MTDELRTILHELAADEPPQGLGHRALATASRRRRTRVLTAAAAAVLAAALAVPTTLAVRRHNQVAAPPRAGYALMSYQHFSNDPTEDATFAWDPETRRYVRLPYRIAPSADGAWASIGDDRHGHAVVRWEDAIHGRNIHWQPDDPHEYRIWSARGATQLKINLETHLTSYVDPASGRSRIVPWPADLVRNSTWLGIVGLVRDTEIAYLTVGKGAVETYWLVDSEGRVTRKTTVPPSGEKDSETANLPATNPQHLLLFATESISPDGRYVADTTGHLLDTSTLTRSQYRDPVGRQGIEAGYVALWYDDTHLVRTAEAGRPASVSVSDVEGHVTKTVPLDSLPKANGAPLLLSFIPSGQATEGALTITL